MNKKMLHKNVGELHRYGLCRLGMTQFGECLYPDWTTSCDACVSTKMNGNLFSTTFVRITYTICISITL
jgi:hypothetical protein